MHCSKAFQANAGLEDLSSDSRNGLLSKRGAAPRFSCAGLLLASALAASLAGCSGWSKEAHPERPNYEIYPASAIGIDYTELLVAPSRRVGESFEHGKPAIDAKKQRVFVGSSDHGLYALHAGDGSVIWRFETLGAVQAEVLYDEKSDTLFFGSNDGAMYHVAAADGKLLWRFDTRAEVSKLPVLSRGVLYFSNANDTVVAVAAKDGKKLWAYHRSPALGMEIAGHAGVTLHQGKLFTAFSDGNVVALDTHTGREAWRPYDLSAEAEQNLGDIPQYLDVDTTPIYGALDSGDAIFVASYVGGVTALEADSGTPIWDNTGVVGAYQLYYWEEKGRPANAEKHQSEIAPRRLLIAASGYSGLWARDPETGETV